MSSIKQEIRVRRQRRSRLKKQLMKEIEKFPAIYKIFPKYLYMYLAKRRLKIKLAEIKT